MLTILLNLQKLIVRFDESYNKKNWTIRSHEPIICLSPKYRTTDGKMEGTPERIIIHRVSIDEN